MAMQTIETRCNTTTGTRGYTNRLGTQLLERGTPGNRLTHFPSGTSVEPSPICVYIADTLTGFTALIEHQRQQLAKELATTLQLEVEVESEFTQRFVDWRTALGALASTQDPAVAVETFEWSRRTCRVPDVSWGGAKKAYEELETIDWDVQIEQLPPRRSEQVMVRFVPGSHRPPRIVDEPED